MDAHQQALLQAGRCGMCAELVGPRTLFRAAPCPHCGSAAPGIAAQVVEGAKQQGIRRLLVVCILVAAGNLLVGWVPLLDSLVLIAAAIWLRFGVIAPATQLMSARRRVVARMTSRVVVAVLVAATLVVSQLLTLLAVLGVVLKAVVGVLEVAGAAFLVTRYCHWQLEREGQGKPVGTWEWAFLFSLLAMLAGLVIGFVAALTFVFHTLENLLAGGF